MNFKADFQTIFRESNDKNTVILVLDNKKIFFYEKKFIDGNITKWTNETYQLIRKIVKNKRTAELLCPTNHPIGTKRLCLDSNYFETYNKENVSLIDVSNNPIEKITYNGLITNNTEYLFDDLVFATGFDAMTGAVNAIDIRNENDISLKSIWDNGPKTYLGIMVSNFPNLL